MREHSWKPPLTTQDLSKRSSPSRSLEERLEPAKNAAARQLSKEMKIPGFRPGKAPTSRRGNRRWSERLRAEAIDNSLGESCRRGPRRHRPASRRHPGRRIHLRYRQRCGDLGEGRHLARPRRSSQLRGPRDRPFHHRSPPTTRSNEQIDRIRDQFAELETVERAQPKATTSRSTCPPPPAKKSSRSQRVRSHDRRGRRLVHRRNGRSREGLPAGEEATFEGELPEGFGEKGGMAVTYKVRRQRGAGPRTCPNSPTSGFRSHRGRNGCGPTGRLHAAGSSRQVRDLLERLPQPIWSTSSLRVHQPRFPKASSRARWKKSCTASRTRCPSRASRWRTTSRSRASPRRLRSRPSQDRYRNVQTELMLDAIADDAGIVVTDEEMDEILDGIGESDGKTAADIRETLTDGQKKKLTSDILRQKAHEELMKAAVPMDEDGGIIDFDALAASTARRVAGPYRSDARTRFRRGRITWSHFRTM